MSTKTQIKVPETLTRAAEISVTGEGEQKAFSMSISSDVPYKRYDWWNDKEYWEVLDHKGMDETRLKAGLPILFNHDRDQHLGRATKYENDGKKCTVSEIIWSGSEFAQQKKKDAETGALPTTSVGYRLLDEGVCIGEKDGLPVYKFKFEPFEGSLVTVPADTTVGVGRDAAEIERLRSLPGNLIAIHLQKEVDPETEKGHTQPTQTKAMAEQTTAEKPQIDVSKERNEAVAAERSRVSSIQATSRHFAEKGLGGRKIDTAELAAKCIAEGKTEQEFRNMVMDGNFAEVKPVETTTPEIGMSSKEKRSFSLVRAMGCLARKQPVDGLEKEASDAHAKLIGREAQGLEFFIPQDVWRARAFPNGISEHQRALFTNVFTGAGALVGTDLLGASLIELLRNQMFVVAMGARTLSGLKGNVAIPRQTGGATASWLAEDSTATRTQQTVGQLNLVPHKLMAATAYTQQLLQQSSVDVENFVRQDLMAVIAIERDRAAINGSGVSGEPLGILGLGTQLSTPVTLASAESLTYAKALEFETNVALNNAATGKLGYMTSIRSRSNAKTLAEIQSTNSNPVWKNDTVNGYPARATNQMPTATGVLFGNWDDLILADWADTSVLVDPYSLSLQSQISVVMQMLCDNGVRHTKSFSKGTT